MRAFGSASYKGGGQVRTPLMSALARRASRASHRTDNVPCVSRLGASTRPRKGEEATSGLGAATRRRVRPRIQAAVTDSTAVQKGRLGAAHLFRFSNFTFLGL